LRGGFGIAHVDSDDIRATAFSSDQVAGRIGLTGEIGPPQQDEIGVLPHILLGVGVEDAGEAEPEGAQPPADHRRIPLLTAVQMGEAPHELTADARAIVGGGIAMPGPEPHRFSTNRLQARDDEVQCLIPGGLAPGIFGAAVTHQRSQQPLGIADDLA
jgi:hypothetical protein